MFELSKWSPPTDLGILVLVNPNSSPRLPVFLGPESNIPPE